MIEPYDLEFDFSRASDIKSYINPSSLVVLAGFPIGFYIFTNVDFLKKLTGARKWVAIILYSILILGLSVSLSRRSDLSEKPKSEKQSFEYAKIRDLEEE